MRLKDKVAIITGTGTGIGKYIAELFAKEGAKVVAASRREINGQPVVDGIVSSGGKAIFVKCDVSVEEDVKRVVKKAVETYGRIDILVNNAGVNFVKNFEDILPEDWDRVINTDLRGTYLFCRHCIIEMLKTGGGSIVNMATVHTHASLTGAAPYDAAKWGMIGLTKALSVEFAARNIRVNALSPGLIHTQIWDDIMNAAPSKEESIAYWKANIPMGRVGTPEEIAKATLFLASDDASYITGANLFADGGMTSLLVSREPYESKNLEGAERK